MRIRLEHQIREVEFEKKKLEGDLEEKLEVLRTEKRSSEKQLNELKEELENRDQDLSQSKKRQARQLAELHDTKLQLEEVSAKNHELEKKQRKFDSEMYGQQAETAQHKIDKDKSQREKENLQVWFVSVESSILEDHCVRWWSYDAEAIFGWCFSNGYEYIFTWNYRTDDAKASRKFYNSLYFLVRIILLTRF